MDKPNAQVTSKVLQREPWTIAPKPLIQRKPGALRNGAPFADLPEPLQRLRRMLLRDAGGDRVMVQVLAIVPSAGLDAVLVAAELALNRLTHHRHIVEAGNESHRFLHSTAVAKKRIRAREQARKGANPEPPATTP